MDEQRCHRYADCPHAATTATTTTCPWRDDPIFEEDTPQAARTIQIIYVLAVGEVAGEVKGILKPNFSGLYFNNEKLKRTT